VSPTLVWLDLETTGLDPRKDSILEVAVALARFESPFDVDFDGVIKGSWVLGFPRAAWVDLSPFIVDMHTKNRLLEECAASSHGVRGLEQMILSLLEPIGTGKDAPVLAGSSVHFDHEFLKVHMPTLAARLSHRHYDVSAIKLFCQSLGMHSLPKAEAHRAEADIGESIAHARLCARWLASHNHWVEQDA
jgi:oligoribonuclease